MISSICRCSALVHTPSRAEVAQTSSAILVGKRRVQRRNSVVSRAEVEIRSADAAAPPKYIDADGKTVEAPAKEALVSVDGVKSWPVASGVTLLQGTTRNRVRTNIEYALNAGTADNTYLLEGSTNKVVIDVPSEPFLADWLTTLKSLLADKGGAAGITDLVVTHMSPPRVPALRAFLQLRASQGKAPKLRVHVSNPGIQIVEAGIGSDEEGRAMLKYGIDICAVRPGSQGIALGSTPKDVLALTAVPTPRWPDLVTAYHPRHQILFSSKVYSAHVIPEDGSPSDDMGHDVYSMHWHHFFDTTLAPVARQALESIKKIGVVPAGSPSGVWESASLALGKWMGLVPSVAPQDQRPVRTIAPIHGPLIRSCVADVLQSYDSWLAKQLEAQDMCEVVVFYASAYGNTAAIAQALAHGITRSGLGVSSVNLEVATTDEVAEAVRRCAGFAIGSPTLQGHMPTQVQAALGTLLQQPGASQVPCGVFGSFGWSGEAVADIAQKLRDGGYKMAFDPIKIKFTPGRDALLQCEQAGVTLANAVRKQQRRKELAVVTDTKKEATATGAQLAMGRVVGPLCVVTARDGDATGAMLASWVSQAAFAPPSMTISIKRDRAMEPLLVPGANISVSVLAEGPNTKRAMRQLARPFAPGEDRLAGLETKEAGNGCPILSESASYLECEVAQRMEAGDHYVVLVRVTGGDVLDAAVPSSVHHRKVGNHY